MSARTRIYRFLNIYMHTFKMLFGWENVLQIVFFFSLTRDLFYYSTTFECIIAQISASQKKLPNSREIGNEKRFRRVVRVFYINFYR